jgi:hypothetical protein
LSVWIISGGHGGVAVGQDVLDVLVFLFQCHVVDVMPKVTVSTDVAGLAASVAGLCKGNLTNLRRELHLSLAKGNPK